MNPAKTLARVRSALALCACGALLGACANAPGRARSPYEGMIPAYTAAQKHPESVAIEVKGAEGAGAKDEWRISGDEFRQALADSIVLSRVFSRVAEDRRGRYLLSVDLIRVEQPDHGFSRTVKMEAGWTLRRADTKKTVWEARIRSEHTATPADGIAGSTRLRLAAEGAARENIAAGLDRISKLDL